MEQHEISPEVTLLISVIHEGLPPELSGAWSDRVGQALQPGADTTRVWPEFVIWLLTDVSSSPEGDAVAELYRRWLAGDRPAGCGWKGIEVESGWVKWAKVWVTDSKRPLWVAAEMIWKAVKAEKTDWSRMADKLEGILKACPLRSAPRLEMTPDDLHRYLQTLLGDRSLTPEAVFLEIDKLIQALQRITTAMRLADPLAAVKCAERVGVAHVFWYELMELLDLKYGTDVVPAVRRLLGPNPRTKTEG